MKNSKRFFKILFSTIMVATVTIQSLAAGHGEKIKVHVAIGDAVSGDKNGDIENKTLPGTTSKELLEELMKSSKAEKGSIAEAISKADEITLSIGTNNLLEAFQKYLADQSIDRFNEVLLSYREDYTGILSEIRKLNPKGKLNVMAIEDPFAEVLYHSLHELGKQNVSAMNRIIKSQEPIKKYNYQIIDPLKEA